VSPAPAGGRGRGVGRSIVNHLILLAFYFPPDGGGGSQRPASIARHAADRGWRVTVVTRPAEAMRNMWNPADPALHDDALGRDAVRVPMPAESSAGAMVPPDAAEPDPWLLAVAKRVEQLHRADPAAAVVLTMPPYGLCPAVELLKTRLPELPLIVDLRDPWAFDGAVGYASAGQWRVNRRWMGRTLDAADALVANTPEAGKRFAEVHPALADDRLAVVPNGYEPDDFARPRPDPPDGYTPGKCHLVHTGTLHSRALLKERGLLGRLRKLKGYRAEPIDVAGRTAAPLLEAVRRLQSRNTPGIEALRIVLVGIDDPATTTLVREAGLDEQVLLTGYQPHETSIAWLRHAQCLFLPLHGLPPGHRSLIVPGKTYEYLAAGRPILAALPEGDARDLVERSGRGYLADPCDPDAIADALAQVLRQHRAGQLPDGPSAQWVRDYARPALTARFFEFVERIVALGPRSNRVAAASPAPSETV